MGMHAVCFCLTHIELNLYFFASIACELCYYCDGKHSKQYTLNVTVRASMA